MSADDPVGKSETSALPRWVVALAHWVAVRPKSLLVASILILLTCLPGIWRLHFDADSRSFFGQENEQKIALDELEATFGRYNNLIFIVTAKSGDVFSPDVLQAIEVLTQRAWSLPFSSRVDSLATYHRSFAQGDEIIVAPLFESVETLTAKELADLRAVALAQDELVDRMISRDAKVTGVFVAIQTPGASRSETTQLLTAARDLQASMLAEFPTIEVRLSGGVAADGAFAEAGREDLMTLGPIMLGFILLALTVGLRSWVGTLTTLCVVIASVLSAAGVAGYLGININSATGGAPVIIMTLCIADCVHLFATRAQRLSEGSSLAAAMTQSLAFNGIAIFMTTFTDVLGFMALNFGDSPPLQDLGNVVSIGVSFGFLYSVILAPAMITLLPAQKSHRALWAATFFARLADFLVSRHKPIFLAFAALAVVLGIGVTQIVYDDDFVEYFDESFTFRQDTEYLQDHLTGIQVLQFALPAGKAEGALDPAFLERVEAFSTWLLQQPEVRKVNSLVDVLKRLNKNLHGDDPAHFALPESRELAAQLLLFYELSLPFGLDLNSSVNVDKSVIKLTATLSRVSAAQIRQVAGKAEAWLAANAPEMATRATGLSMAYAYLSKTNVEAMIDGTFVALTLISLTMFLVLRNWRLSILSLPPNLLPAIMALGAWGWISGQVNLAVSVVAAISFGIIVDDTVHFLTHYAVARRSGATAASALRHTLSEVGLAVFVTSAVLVVGFAVLATSGFAVSMEMGALTSITIVIALVAEVAMVPTLLIWFDRKRRI